MGKITAYVCYWHVFFSFKIIPTNPSSKHLWHHVNFIVLPLFRGSTQEAQCSTRDPTSSYDLRKWEWSTHCDGQHAAERGEQTATGHREAPGPHTCYRGVCHPGGSRAISCVCKCTIPASLEARRDKQALSQHARGVNACRGLSSGQHQPSVTTSHDSSQLLFDAAINYTRHLLRQGRWMQVCR